MYIRDMKNKRKISFLCVCVEFAKKNLSLSLQIFDKKFSEREREKIESLFVNIMDDGVLFSCLKALVIDVKFPLCE